MLTDNDQDREIDLEKRVTSFLASKQIPSLRSIDVRVDQGTITLRGQVRSFYEKQLCLNCCQRVAGVQAVIDKLEVGRPKVKLTPVT